MSGKSLSYLCGATSPPLSLGKRLHSPTEHSSKKIRVISSQSDTNENTKECAEIDFGYYTRYMLG